MNIMDVINQAVFGSDERDEAKDKILTALDGIPEDDRVNIIYITSTGMQISMDIRAADVIEDLRASGTIVKPIVEGLYDEIPAETITQVMHRFDKLYQRKK